MSRFTPTLLATTLISGALMATAATAHAGKGNERGERMSPISRDAFLEQRATRFDALDADGNGVITLAEMEAALARPDARNPERAARMAQKHFSRLDADQTGEVSRDVYLQQAAARFDAADTDGNGELSRDERKAQYKAMKGERKGWRARKDGDLRRASDAEG